MKRNLFICIFSCLFVSSVGAATFSLSGNARIGSNLYSNLDATPGTLSGAGNTSTYLEHRILLRPDVIVDDRFTIKSEWNLLQLNPSGSNIVPEAFGTVLDGSQNQFNNPNLLDVRRAYLNWASDWGIFRFGRMPKSWGLGIKYDAGEDVLDDFGTTVDRVGFQAMLGNLGLNFGFEKGAEALLNNDNDDIEVYELSLDYSNPESLFDVGLMYTRNVRLAASSATLSSSHDLTIFSRKRWGEFQIGGEMASVGQDNASNVVGMLAQFDWMPGNLTLSGDIAFAQAASDAQYTFNPNYRPFLLLFRQSVGPTQPVANVRGGQAGNAVGSAVGSGTGAGAALAKLRLTYGFSSNRYVLGSDLGYAALARKGNNASSALGVEWDIHLKQRWYENFHTDYALGMLFPGDAFGAGSQVAWGFQIRGALEF